MKPRNRFNRNCIASSRGSYVWKAHIEYIKECHKRNQHIIANITINIKVAPKYHAKCFGKMMQITEREAIMLGPQLTIKL